MKTVTVPTQLRVKALVRAGATRAECIKKCPRHEATRFKACQARCLSV